MTEQQAREVIARCVAFFGLECCPSQPLVTKHTKSRLTFWVRFFPHPGKHKYRIIHDWLLEQPEVTRVDLSHIGEGPSWGNLYFD